MSDGSGDRTTLSRVAEHAGVSSSTVSRVLNGRSGVSKETRVRVEELLKAHDYNRRNPGTSRSRFIELVFSEVSSAWVVETMRGIEQVARAEGLALVVTISGDRNGPEQGWLAEVLQRDPAGIVLLFSDLEPDAKAQLSERGIPFVLVDPVDNPALDVLSVGSANWAGGLLAARHLAGLGHRDIALITGPDTTCTRARRSGYLSALEEAGIPIRPELIVTGQHSREDGTRLGDRLLSLPKPPTAIFAMSDIQALGVYEAARRRRLVVPTDLSVVGYDDIEVTAWIGPPMTTVRQPIREMADEAARILVRARAGQARDSLRTELETRLVVRESTAAPRG